MTVLRLVACDDEPLALQRLTDLVTYCRDATLVEAVLDPREVLPIVRAARPDVLLLDLEMPKLRGFDLLDRLAAEDFGPGGWCPQIIIVTAHSHFAALAFDSGTLDFLTKPVRLARLELALDRARIALDRQSATRRLAELGRELEQLRRLANPDAGAQRYLWLRGRDELFRIDIAQVSLIRSEAEYVRIHVGENSYLHREALTALTTRLDSTQFARIHRSTIVRIDGVRSIRRTFHGGLRVSLLSGEELPVGRTYRRAVATVFRSLIKEREDEAPH